MCRTIWSRAALQKRLLANSNKCLAGLLVKHYNSGLHQTRAAGLEIFIRLEIDSLRTSKTGGHFSGENMVKLQVREKESIQEAVRRFRKIVERSGIKKEMRRREYYEKPSETKRRARLRAERRNLRARKMAR